MGKILTKLTIGLICLPGCTSMWKGGYHIETATKELLYIQYDPNLASQEAITQVANDHCAQFQLKPQLIRANHGGGIVSNKLRYTCVDK